MYNTGNPVPSSALEDMADNAQTFDALVTQTEGTTTDRLGRTRRVFQQILMDMGFQPLSGSFQTGATLTQCNQVLQDKTTGVFYSWNGTLPKVVPAGSTPATVGGVGVGAWVDRTDVVLRNGLGEVDGDSLTGYATYAQIRSYSGDKKFIRCGGRINIYSGDMAHGKFYRNDADTTSPDNDGTILIDALGRRWFRKYTGSKIPQWFGAVGDGITDDTIALSKACSAEGINLHLPDTNNGYRLTSTLVLDKPITISGNGTAPFGVSGPYDSRGRGSWLFFDHPGVGILCEKDAGGSFIASVRLSNIGSYRKHINAITLGWTPTVFDTDFIFSNTDAVLDDVMILNAYNAINVIKGDAGRLTCKNIRGQWFNVGLNIDKCLDTVRLNGVHMWPFWSNDINVTNWQQNNSTFIALNRCDNPMFTDIFSIYTSIALRISQNSYGTVSKLRVSGMDCDMTNNAILVDSSVNNATAQFENFTSYGQNNANTNGYNIRLQGSYCRFDFGNLEGSNLSRGLIRLEGLGNVVRITNPRVNTWGRLTNTDPALDVLASNLLRISGTPILECGSGSSVVAFLGGVIKIPQLINNGTAIITSAATSVTVPHGLPIAPTLTQIQVWMVTGVAAAKEIWVDASSITSSNFTVKCDTPPGANISIAWRAAIE